MPLGISDRNITRQSLTCASSGPLTFDAGLTVEVIRELGLVHVQVPAPRTSVGALLGVRAQVVPELESGAGDPGFLVPQVDIRTTWQANRRACSDRAT